MKSLLEQIECVLREIAMRQRVYPRWVDAGKMSKEKAAHEIDAMREVLATLKTLQDDQQGKLGL